jgi:uncharacterized damage-inducible protein DinB
VAGLSAAQLSWHPNLMVESIGTLLLHIAAIEFSYIQEDIMQRPMGEEWKIALPIRFGIPQISDRPLEYFVGKLEEVRNETLAVLTGLSDADLDRAVVPLDQEDTSGGSVSYTIDWLLYHLVEHEAHHKGQIAVMLRLLPEELRGEA